MEIRALDPEADASLYEEAWEWQFVKSERWQALFSVWTESREEFLSSRNRPHQIDFGIFDGGEFCGLITLEELEPRVFEAHIDYPAKTARLIISDAIESVKRHIFERGAVCVYIFIADLNRPVARIATSAGFKKTGVEILFGSWSDRVLRWQQFILTDE